MENNRPVIVVTYVRVSTQEQATEGTSIEHQAYQTTAYCKSQDWEIVRNYADPGYSGKDGERPGLKRLLADAKAGLFDRVAVYKLDRLSRNLRLLLEIEETLRSYGVSLNSVKETLDTSTAIGRTTFQVLGLVAQWEREAIIERTRSGRVQRYKEGRWASGKPAYGYSYDRDSKKLILDESESRVVRRIFDWYRDGKPLSNIANMLNEEKVKPRSKSGKGWRGTAVRNILINPAYKGTLIVNRHSHIANIAKADMAKVITIAVPPIVAESQWQLVQERLPNNTGARPMKSGRWLLQGLITCGQCGLSFGCEKGHSNGGYYSCRGKLHIRHLDGSPRCTAPRLRADWLEDEVWQRIEDIINDPNKLEPLLKEAIDNLRSREEELKSRIMPIDDDLKEIAEQKAKLADEWVIKSMKPEKFRELQHKLDTEEIRLKSLVADYDPAQIEELERTRSMVRFWQSELDSMAWNTENEDGSMAKLVEKPHKAVLQLLALEDSDMSRIVAFPSAKREILDKLQVRLVVFDDRIEVNALFPIEPISNQVCTPTRRGGLRG